MYAPSWLLYSSGSCRRVHQSLCTDTTFSYLHQSGTSHQQPGRRVEGQPRRIYFQLPSNTRINWESRVCRAGCIDLQASTWILRDLYHAWGLFQPHRATFLLFLTPGHLQGRVQTSYSMPASKWVRRGNLSHRDFFAPRARITGLYTRSVWSFHVLTGTGFST